MCFLIFSVWKQPLYQEMMRAILWGLNSCCKGPTPWCTRSTVDVMMSISNLPGSFMQVLELEHEDEPNSSYCEDVEVESTLLKAMMLIWTTLTMLNLLALNLVRWILGWMTWFRSYACRIALKSPIWMMMSWVVADKVEIMRLKGLGVLWPIATFPPGGVKKLTTRFVRTWRDKVIVGTKLWLRCSRFAAGEFSWLSPERQDLFSPAASSITSRLLPYCYLHRFASDSTQVLAALDIGDAFLTDDQSYNCDVWIGVRWCWGICCRKGLTRPARWITSLVSSSHILFVWAFEHGSIPFVSMPVEFSRLQVLNAFASGWNFGGLQSELSWWSSFEGFEGEVQG